MDYVTISAPNLEKYQELMKDQFNAEFCNSFEHCSDKIKKESNNLIASHSIGKERQLISSSAHMSP